MVRYHVKDKKIIIRKTISVNFVMIFIQKTGVSSENRPLANRDSAVQFLASAASGNIRLSTTLSPSNTLVVSQTQVL